ncbi:hypothetical protein SAMN04487894_102368 [Niabella drilacis]|uniref:Uncharacterized protein n=2 Tax=Niabella drilacis (strain DSM 25811 / CCM 8410 / CCUG 62505 / LMG 26954 / E90) TaxID=1285928 RepID=A0A1G6LKU1_NIADE|nr:hypothetical protein SAMN04487894_102368 [Niabella drilacis]
MNNDLYQEDIKQIKQQYACLDLTDDQAAFLLRHQNEPYPTHTEYYLNTWEHHDYEDHIFQKILNTAQFDHYLERREARLATHIAFLKQQDEEIKRNIEYKKQLLSYYCHTYVPQLLQTRLQYPNPFFAHRSKIRYIKEEYSNCCKVWKLRVTSQHFRNCRNYSPQLFELHMLDLQLLNIMPDYQQFKADADMPTQTTLTFLLDKSRCYLADFISFFDQKEAEETRTKKDAAIAVFGKAATSGWHIEPLPESNEERSNRLLFLLLMIEKVPDNGQANSCY